MRKINRDIILSNISEVREELQRIEGWLTSGEPLSEGGLEVAIEHAYHHLNFAWNARHVSSNKYKTMTDSDFNEWGKFPNDIELPFLEKDK